MNVTVHALAHEQRQERAERTERRAQAEAKVARLVAGKPKILIQPGEIESAVDEAEAALMKSDRGLYQRANAIVYAARSRELTADGRGVTVTKILERGDHALLEDLSVAGAFLKVDQRSGAEQLCNPPMPLVRTLKERANRLRLPVLRAVISAPTLRADGSILEEPGYDVPTGLLFDPGASIFPKMPERPSRDDALAALRALSTLTETFPFKEEADRSVALSAMITACIRTSLPNAPMHAFTAPVAGTGKSMLVDIVSVLATGHRAAHSTQGRTDEEAEKRLGSLLLTGDSIIAIDNCERPIGGDLLCAMLTQQSLKIRILGKSESPELPTHALVTATGNNLTLLGDMTRRTLLCSLDPQVERPELRRFANDPLVDAEADRGGLVAAALTVVRAYILAGKPAPLDRLGSFENWSDTVRSALVWLGCADPVATMERVRASDPHLDELSTVMAQWQEIIGDRHITVAEVIRIASAWDPCPGGGSGFLKPDFREALFIVAGAGPAISSRKLGKWLSRNKGRIVAERFFCEVGSTKGVSLWKLACKG